MNSSDLSEAVQAHLKRNGWRVVGAGSAGSLWADGVGSEQEVTTVAVPSDLKTGSREWDGLVQRLALYEQRSTAIMAFSLISPRTDITRMRAADDIVIADSIPLTAGVGLIDAAYKMLRATATTARRPRPHIAGNFSKVGDDLLERVRMGHTETGSYVLPLLIPLTEVKEPDERTFDDEVGVERVAAEPSERRVTRTLAEALTALSARVVQPEHEPRPGDMPEAVAAGVSRELVLAVRQILTEPAVSQFSAEFEWAAAIVPPAAVQHRIEVSAQAVHHLDVAARLLRSNRSEPPQEIVGPIVEVRHVPGDPFGEVSIQVVRNGRPAEVRVTLTSPQLDPTHDWMRTSRTVVVQGVVSKVPGHRLRIDRPAGIFPLDERFLSDSFN